MDEGELDALEHYLQHAEVLDVSSFSTTTAHHSFRLILHGGVGVLAKPMDTAPEGDIMCRREAAAWVVARFLGWSDLVAATVMREMTFPTTGDRTHTSVQVIWPDYHPDADVAVFTEEDIWRAAVYDAVIGQTDRGGHNWLAVPGSTAVPGAGTTQLKLVDHGYSFRVNLSDPGSTFYSLRKGEDLPHETTEALAELVGRRTAADALHELLPSDEADAVFSRAEALLSAGVLDFS